MSNITTPKTVSGMRPTGPLHIGHYFGTLKNWISLQEKTQPFFFIADWHALTSNYAHTQHLREYTYEILIDWLSVGLDPQKSILFQQSKIMQHAELNLLLGMITPLSWLERNPTYKEQQQELTTTDLNNFGFLGYPVLMAADILLYRPKLVPVGQDQLPHLELTREIARRFNNTYSPLFPEPEASLTPAAKCPGLDGRKMSKSYDNAIFLKDPIDEIKRKIQKMFTDPARLKKTDPGNPKNCNLFPYHQLLTDSDTQNEICKGCTTAKIGCVDCKKIFLTNLISFLEPIQEQRARLAEKKDFLKEIIHEGTNKAQIEAEQTMGYVRNAIGV